MYDALAPNAGAYQHSADKPLHIMGKSDHLDCAGKDKAAILLPHAVR
jgi:hypothetical protein